MASSEELCRNMAFSLALRCIQNNPWYVYKTSNTITTMGNSTYRRHTEAERKCVEIDCLLPFTLRYVIILYIFLCCSLATDFLPTFMYCMGSGNFDVVQTALRNLPEYVLLCQGKTILVSHIHVNSELQETVRFCVIVP